MRLPVKDDMDVGAGDQGIMLLAVNPLDSHSVFTSFYVAPNKTGTKVSSFEGILWGFKQAC